MTHTLQSPWHSSTNRRSRHITTCVNIKTLHQCKLLLCQAVSWLVLPVFWYSLLFLTFSHNIHYRFWYLLFVLSPSFIMTTLVSWLISPVAIFAIVLSLPTSTIITGLVSRLVTGVLFTKVTAVIVYVNADNVVTGDHRKAENTRLFFFPITNLKMKKLRMSCNI